MAFADNVKQLRLNRGLTQEEIAAALGITRRTWQNYELGICMPRTEKMVRRIAKFFDVSLTDLLLPEDYYIINVSKYGGTKPKHDLKSLLSELTTLCSNGKLSEEDINLVEKTLNELFPNHNSCYQSSDGST